MRRNIRILYLIRFATACIPAYVIERLFWEQRGMTIQDVIYAEIVFALTLVVLEIPFGLMVDRFGRKMGMIIGTSFECLSFLVLLHAFSLSSFLFAMVLAGIGTAAISGTEDALLYESMQQTGAGDRFEQTVGQMNAVGLGTAGGAALMGAWLAQSFDLITHYYISFCFLVCAVLASCLLSDTHSARPSTERTNDSGWNRLLKIPSFLRIVSFTVMFGTTITFLDEFWQLYVRDQGIAVSWFGIILISLMMAQGIGNLLPKPTRPSTVLCYLLLLYMSGIILLAVMDGSWSVLVLIGIFLIYGWSEPVLTTLLQDCLPDERRATGSSAVSFAESLATMAVGLGFGHISQAIGLNGAYFYLGLTGLLLGLGMMFVLRIRG
ncbi:MFS transporter [Exiguobacterium sp. KRL4]|uniref:MFS transporter n=1 Tax=Exiguobacterium sp. KRL4 TaxID=1914536 RepID=UPI001F007C78|nr:MFS transporter [Exiguobacterium sp. KRL4]